VRYEANQDLSMLPALLTCHLAKGAETAEDTREVGSLGLFRGCHSSCGRLFDGGDVYSMKKRLSALMHTGSVLGWRAKTLVPLKSASYASAILSA